MQNSTHHNAFPFRSVLNLRLLIEYWERAIAKGTVPSFAKDMLDYINDGSRITCTDIRYFNAR
jgi:hypothetical protein